MGRELSRRLLVKAYAMAGLLVDPERTIAVDRCSGEDLVRGLSIAVVLLDAKIGAGQTQMGLRRQANGGQI